jgi:hypothetical protein
MHNHMTPSTYLAVKCALQDERAQPQPSELVIAVCEAWLRMFRPPLMTTFVEMSQPED